MKKDRSLIYKDEELLSRKEESFKRCSRLIFFKATAKNLFGNFIRKIDCSKRKLNRFLETSPLTLFPMNKISSLFTSHAFLSRTILKEKNRRSYPINFHVIVVLIHK